MGWQSRSTACLLPSTSCPRLPGEEAASKDLNHDSKQLLDANRTDDEKSAEQKERMNLAETFHVEPIARGIESHIFQRPFPGFHKELVIPARRAREKILHVP